MQGHPSRLVEFGRRLLLAMVAALLAGCSPLPAAGARVDVRAVTADLEARTNLQFSAAPPPDGLPGIPTLAGTHIGVAAGERVVILDFYGEDETRSAVGSGDPRMSGTELLTRENLVVLYERDDGAADYTPAIREALSAAPLRD